MCESDLPKLAMTMGDVAGIGPEIVARACCDSRLSSCCRPVVVGHPRILQRAADLVNAPFNIVPIESLEQWEYSSQAVACWNPTDDQADDVTPGSLDARAGRAAFEYLSAATRAALRGEIDCITTAPLNKKALALAGLNYPGHTEILAEHCGIDNFAMMLYLPAESLEHSQHGLGVAHVTLHTSIRSVPELLSTDAVRGKIELIDRFLRDVGCPNPRIGVCALNPHAGENGLFGDEEQRLISPAVSAAVKSGIDATGPVPADALFRRAASGNFDGVVAMYHDQGHIAIKMLGFDRAVNITLGLPIVRTSPSHGTAFDIAWQGIASYDGMLSAIRMASQLARSSNARGTVHTGNRESIDN